MFPTCWSLPFKSKRPESLAPEFQRWLTDSKNVTQTKMASVEALLNICSRYFDQSFCQSSENTCKNCFRWKDYLKVLTGELKSAQLIIKLLQDELKTKVNEPMTTENQPTCVNHKPQDTIKSESACESGWTEIQRNNRVTKQLKKTSRCLK